MKINYVVGDATDPTKFGDSKAIKIICHICNDHGGWGSGFVVALSNKFGDRNNVYSPEYAYRHWHKNSHSKKPFVLGQIQYVNTPIGDNSNVWVCNMIAQRDYKPLKEGNDMLLIPNINYSSLEECLTRIKVGTLMKKVAGQIIELHMPRIGCGLGGGRWHDVEYIIRKVFAGMDLEIFVYDLTDKPDSDILGPSVVG